MPLPGLLRVPSVSAGIPFRPPSEMADEPRATERRTLGALLGMPSGEPPARESSALAPPPRRTLAQLLDISLEPVDLRGLDEGASPSQGPDAAAPEAAADPAPLPLPPWERWLDLSAAGQYRHAKAMAPEQRQRLALALEAHWREDPDPRRQAQEMGLWMSVLKAQLRAHHAGREVGLLSRIGLQACSAFLACAPSGQVFPASDDSSGLQNPMNRPLPGPEYRAAFNHFLRVIGDASLAQPLRDAVALALAAHRDSGTTLTADHARRLAQDGILALAESGYREVGAGPLRQVPPVRAELRASYGLWLEAPEAFEGDKDGSPFAQLLERRLPSSLALENTDGSGATLLGEGAQVIEAIARDGGLRSHVFAMAENALGSCGDNVAEGFSAIVLAVRNHQMAEAVKAGRIDAAGLDVWARQQFRLGSLETAVHRFILTALTTPGIPEDVQTQLRKEPLETMLHAKVRLKAMLGLPDSVPSEMTYAGQSVLTPGDLSVLAEAVMEAESDPDQWATYLLSNETWRFGMLQLHPEPFAEHEADFEKDAFHDRDLPRDGDAHVQERVDYNEAAAEFTQRKRAAEDALLLRLNHASM